MLFNNLSLEITPGHIYGIFGKNGAGKTTLLKIMAGLSFPQSGTVNTLGYPAAKRDSEMLQNLYLLTEEIYVPHLTIAKFMKVYAPFYPNFDEEQFSQYLNDFEINSVNDYLDKLSLGQKKKVLICFALATNTQVLIMDEPTNGLDIPSKTIFRRIISSAPIDDRIILISTHQVRDLHTLIDSILILDDGEIILNADTDTITEKLVFEVSDRGNEENILYSEEDLRGFILVRENLDHIDSKLDIELLFNAAMHNKQKIKSLFSK